jgi:alkane 1-monooxygenase
MQSANVLRETPGSHASPLETLRVLGLHLLCLSVPVYVLAFVSTGPHVWYAALPWLLLVPVVAELDRRSPPARHPPLAGVASWPFDALLVLLTAIQVANVVLAARLVHRGGFFAVDTVVAVIVVGVNSGYSAIVVAHELIHRPSKALQLLGRLLLATVSYEHFYVEHVRGHHLRMGTAEDPATSRYGETYSEFWKRTVPAQFRSAFRLETKRLGDVDMKWYDRRNLRNEVVHGVVAEAAIALGLAVAFGPGALVVHLGQAYVAVGLLEATNYFEHYGLRRTGRKVRPVDSWDAESWWSLFSLVGLSRHADHHAYASRPYQALRTWEESPKLPYGYTVMGLLVIFDNARARALLDAELERRKLGPFAEAA